jgi:hypothetical protein
MLRRQWHRTTDPLFIHLNKQIIKYNNTIIDPSTVNFNNPIITQKSWYCNFIYNYEHEIISNQFNFNNSINNEPEYKTIKINIFPNQSQKDIFKYWFNSFNIMYNETILFLKRHLPLGNFKFLKTYKSNYAKLKSSQKLILSLDKDIDKITSNRDKYINKLNKFFDFNKKNAKIYNVIAETKCSINKCNKELTELNKQKNILLIQNKNLSKFESLYFSLKKHIDTFLDDKYIRTNYLKDKKKEIENKFSFKNDSSKKIHTHSMDGAIKKACANYKTCLDNYINGRIKRFRIKCRNLEKSNKIVEIDTTSFNFDKNDNSYYICKNILGKLDLRYNKEEFKIIKPSVSNIFYNGLNYTLQMPIPIAKTNIPAKSSFIALDGGARDFLTGFTNNSFIKFGNNSGKLISKYYNRIDKLNSLNIFQKNNINELLERERNNFIELIKKNIKNNNKYYEKIIEENEKYDKLCSLKKSKSLIDLEIEKCKNIIQKNEYLFEKQLKGTINIKEVTKILRSLDFNKERKERLEKIKNNNKEKEKYEKYMWYLKKRKIEYYNKKIKNKINELHWQIASEISENYEVIILGKINIKSILMNNKLSKETKRVIQSLSHYNFREKLVYKCLSKTRKIIVQEEKYTTKMCSCCGHYNEWIRGEKKIKCKGCLKEYDRDVGASQNIYMSALK